MVQFLIYHNQNTFYLRLTFACQIINKRFEMTAIQNAIDRMRTIAHSSRKVPLENSTQWNSSAYCFCIIWHTYTVGIVYDRQSIVYRLHTNHANLYGFKIAKHTASEPVSRYIDSGSHQSLCHELFIKWRQYENISRTN